jgi:hypothetical protein
VNSSNTPALTLALLALAPLGCAGDHPDSPDRSFEFRDLEAGLELHWTFEDRDGNQILDVSGNGRHGTVHGGGAFVASPTGEALSLDGVDDYVSFAGPRSPALYGGVDGAFTLSARVRVADLGKYNTLCYGCGPLNLMYVGTPIYGPRAMTAVLNQSTGGLAWPWTTPALADDTWVEITMIVEGGVGTRYYLDCALDSNNVNADVGLKDYNYSSLGQGSDASRWFAGEVDELRVWSRALSEAEITSLCPEPPLDEDLELHWTFEDRDGDQILDVSGNGRHGTVHGGASFVAAPVGEAVSLDGVDDYISLVGPRSPALYGGVDGSFTVNARVRVDDVGKDNTLCYGCGPFNSMYVGSMSHGPRAMAALLNQSTGGLTWPWTTPALADSTWVEVTMVVEGGVGTRYYLNCALDSELANANVGLEDYGYSSVGQGSSASKWFAGEIDELQIWSRALSPAQVAELCPEPALDEGLELHWTFEDRDGDQILDVSGNGRHGSNKGGVFVASPQGEALSLDGVDDYVTFTNPPRDPALFGGPDGAFTLSTRVRVADVEAVNTFCYGCGPLNTFALGKLASGNRASAKLYKQGGGFAWPMTSSSLVDDTWVEVTMTVDGTTGARFYLDCGFDSELLDPNIMLANPNYSSLGEGTSASTWFLGEIDSFRVWSRVLSDFELAAICH